MGLLRGPGSSEHFPRISRNPLGNHTPRGSGMVSGRGHGKSSRGWGPWAGVPVHQHHVLPTDGPEPGGGYCLAAGPELCPIQALFLAPRGRGKESKERSSCSQWNLCLERIPGPAGPEKAVTVGSKDPALKRSWQGAVVQGSQREGTDGAPLALYTHLALTNCSDTQRNRGTGSPVPPIVTKHL